MHLLVVLSESSTRCAEQQSSCGGSAAALPLIGHVLASPRTKGCIVTSRGLIYGRRCAVACAAFARRNGAALRAKSASTVSASGPRTARATRIRRAHKGAGGAGRCHRSPADNISSYQGYLNRQLSNFIGRGRGLFCASRKAAAVAAATHYEFPFDSDSDTY